MNTARVIFGGIVAGIILFIIAGITNGVILDSDWRAWLKAMGPLNHAPSQAIATLIWLVVTILIGLAGMWIYAAVRNQTQTGSDHGGESRRCGLDLLISLAQSWKHRARRISGKDHRGRQLASLVGAVVAMLAGAWVYRD